MRETKINQVYCSCDDGEYMLSLAPSVGNTGRALQDIPHLVWSLPSAGKELVRGIVKGPKWEISTSSKSSFTVCASIFVYQTELEKVLFKILWVSLDVYGILHNLFPPSFKEHIIDTKNRDLFCIPYSFLGKMHTQDENRFCK